MSGSAEKVYSASHAEVSLAEELTLDFQILRRMKLLRMTFMGLYQ